MQHRDFLRLTATVSVASVLPLWNRAVFAASRPALPIPTLLTAGACGRTALTTRVGKTQPGALHAITWGYNGPLLGPALQLAQGRTITVDIINQLAEETTLHWRGLEAPGEIDNGPQGVIAPGAIRAVSSAPTQRAAICWSHPHQHGTTDRQMTMRLVGLVPVEDEESGRLLLSKQWGIDDVLMIVQDKKLTVADEIDCQLNVMSTAVGWLGGMLLTNGAPCPEYATPRGRLRLRLLNGYNACSLDFVINDERPLYVVTSDDSLLAEPAKVDELPVLMGECFEVLVDISDGKPFNLVTLLVSQVGVATAPFDKPWPALRVQPLVILASGKSLDTLAMLSALPSLAGLTQCQLQLSMGPMLGRVDIQVLMEKYGDQMMAGTDRGMMGHDDMSNMSSMHHDDMSSMSNINHEAGRDHGISSGKGFDFHNASRINDKTSDMNVPMFAAIRGQYEY